MAIHHLRLNAVAKHHLFDLLCLFFVYSDPIFETKATNLYINLVVPYKKTEPCYWTQFYLFIDNLGANQTCQKLSVTSFFDIRQPMFDFHQVLFQVLLLMQISLATLSILLEDFENVD